MSSKVIKLIPCLFVAVLLCSCGADKHVKQGEKHLALGEYFDAATQFKQAYQQTTPKDKVKRGKIALKMARCYSKSLQTAKAVAAYRNAERYHQMRAGDMLDFAQLLLKQANYKEAQRVFTQLEDSLPGNEMVQTGLTSARMAPTWKEQGSRYTVKKMSVFNSRRADYSPMLLGDEANLLYFTSTRNEAQGDELSGITGTKAGDIFYSEKDDKGKWGKPEAAQGALNTDYDEGACCFTPDGRQMYLTQCVTDPSYPRYAQIVTSDRQDAAWSKVKELKVTADTLSNIAHPAVSPDGEWLYFVSDMPGGKGGLDIWRVRITQAGLGGVENLGEPVNTPGNEMFPTFRPNGDLYFSSDGHPGLGGLDVFIAHVGSDHKYHLTHPGYPLNSEGDDFGLTFEGPYNRGFFSSNRGDARGWDHIYSFENPEIVNTIKGWVYEKDGYELPAAQVYIVGTDGTNQKLSVKSDGSFTYVAKTGVDYLLMATCKGYLNHKEEVRLTDTGDSQEKVLQFALASITAPVLIDNIFYDFDKATLTAASTKALDELVGLLNENPHVTIELRAHCDYKGSEAYNKQLSQRRAQAVVAYLISKGIARDRLTPVGYGKDEPKKVTRKLAEKYSWMKEGDVLTEAYIKKQKNDNQEICNQLNRRTEFVVLRTTYHLFDSNGKLINDNKKTTQEKKQNTIDSDDENIIIDDN